LQPTQHLPVIVAAHFTRRLKPGDGTGQRTLHLRLSERERILKLFPDLAY